MSNISSMTFEQAYAELESIIQQLDGGDLSLEDSVTVFERGRALSAHCQTLLNNAELRVRNLLDDDHRD